jgi:hypothetical protein
MDSTVTRGTASDPDATAGRAHPVELRHQQRLGRLRERLSAQRFIELYGTRARSHRRGRDDRDESAQASPDRRCRRSPSAAEVEIEEGDEGGLYAPHAVDVAHGPV